jgi:hypothetical protein
MSDRKGAATLIEGPVLRALHKQFTSTMDLWLSAIKGDYEDRTRDTWHLSDEMRSAFHFAGPRSFRRLLDFLRSSPKEQDKFEFYVELATQAIGASLGFLGENARRLRAGDVDNWLSALVEEATEKIMEWVASIAGQFSYVRPTVRTPDDLRNRLPEQLRNGIRDYEDLIALGTAQGPPKATPQDALLGPATTAPADVEPKRHHRSSQSEKSMETERDRGRVAAFYAAEKSRDSSITDAAILRTFAAANNLEFSYVKNRLAEVKRAGRQK